MTSNETCNYRRAMEWAAKAERLYVETNDSEHITLCLRFAEVYAHLSVAADVDREADAEARIAECVPEGGSRLQVAVPR